MVYLYNVDTEKRQVKLFLKKTKKEYVLYKELEDNYKSEKKMLDIMKIMIVSRNKDNKQLKKDLV